jgi:DcmR-like sensory protein
MTVEGPRVSFAREGTASTHAMQLYEHDASLVAEVARFVGAGLGSGEALLVIGTRPHLDGILRALESFDLNVEAAAAQGRYVARDAVETLAQFWSDGALDEPRFRRVVGDQIAHLAGRFRSIRVFGEMAGLLAQQGRRDAALHVEQLSNELAKTYPLALFCAYPLRAFGTPPDAPSLQRICAEHSHVLPADSLGPLASNDERLRAIALLQQKVYALEAEVARRQNE